MKFISKLNPLTLSSMIVLFVFGTYELRWSSIYPNISVELTSFLVLFIGLSFFLGWFVLPGMIASNKNTFKVSYVLIGFLTTIITLGTWLDYKYSGGFPLFGKVTYDKYGMPTYHVITTVLATFLSFYIMHFICSGHYKKWLFLVLGYSLLPSLLGLSRGSLILTFIVFLWMYLYNRKSKISMKVVSMTIVVCVMVLYVFGIAGNYRLSKQTGVTLAGITDSSLIYQIGSANSDIKSTSPVAPFFWSYLYLTSPVANLQSSIDNKTNLVSSQRGSLEKLFITQYCPDVISSKVYPLYKSEVSSTAYSARLNVNLTVGTTFYESFLQAGWIGMLLMMLFLMIFPIVYIYMLKQIYPPLVTMGTAVLDAMYMLIIFDNPWAFSALSIQLLLIIILAIVSKIKKVNQV